MKFAFRGFAGFLWVVLFLVGSENPLEIHPKTFHPEESVDTALINSNNGNYSETDKIFIDEHINSDDPNKTASDSEITINSMGQHLSDSITSVENLNVKSATV